MSAPPRIYESLGKCLFCLKPEGPDFTTEHIIPRAISGQQVYIKKGSCRDCNGRANALYEAKALAYDFKTPRYVLGLKRRRKGKSQKPLEPHWAALGDHAETLTVAGIPDVKLGPDEYPGILLFVVLPVAGRLAGVDQSSIQKMRMAFGNMGTAPTPPGMTFRQPSHPGAFALTIAKVGYAFAVAEMGFDAFEHDEIRALLQGERTDVFNFVGTEPGDNAPPTEGLHTIALSCWENWLIAKVRLFSKYGMPAYHVALGKRR